MFSGIEELIDVEIGQLETTHGSFDSSPSLRIPTKPDQAILGAIALI